MGSTRYSSSLGIRTVNRYMPLVPGNLSATDSGVSPLPVSEVAEGKKATVYLRVTLRTFKKHITRLFAADCCKFNLSKW